MTIEPVSDPTYGPALDYLARSPYLNVFISHVLLHDLTPSARNNVSVAMDEGRVVGVAYYGRQIAIASEDSALKPFGEHARARRGERMIVGSRKTVRAFWEAIRNWHAAPRLVRERQLVMMLDRPKLRPYDRRVNVRHAEIDEWRAVAEGSAQMISQELAYDPRRGWPDFDASVRQMIDGRLWWVGSLDGQLCFFCNIGPWCNRTVQLQGIWTPPELRRQGYATSSLAAVCDRLLEISPSISLYVNDFNEAAVALYRRVGFEHVGDLQTILF
jgi:uncharacterized protein